MWLDFIVCNSAPDGVTLPWPSHLGYWLQSRCLTPAIISLLPSGRRGFSLGWSSAKDPLTKLHTSLPCQLVTRQWDFPECEFCYNVWGDLSWPGTLTHDSPPLPYINGTTVVMTFPVELDLSFFKELMRDWRVSAWDSSTCFLPINWQHKCSYGCS